MAFQNARDYDYGLFFQQQNNFPQINPSGNGLASLGSIPGLGGTPIGNTKTQNVTTNNNNEQTQQQNDNNMPLYDPFALTLTNQLLEISGNLLREEKKLSEIQQTNQEAQSYDPDDRSVYIGNIDFSVQPDELREYFETACGSVNRVTIMYDKFTGQSRGFGYIEFHEPESVDNALEFNRTTFKNRELKVFRKRTNVPGFVSEDNEDDDTQTTEGARRNNYNNRRNNYNNNNNNNNYENQDQKSNNSNYKGDQRRNYNNGNRGYNNYNNRRLNNNVNNNNNNNNNNPNRHAKKVYTQVHRPKNSPDIGE